MKKDDVISVWQKLNMKLWSFQRLLQKSENGSTNVLNVNMKDGLFHTEQLLKVYTNKKGK